MNAQELIAALQKFPGDVLVEAYEGEDIGIRIDSPKSGKEIGFISTATGKATIGPPAPWAPSE